MSQTPVAANGGNNSSAMRGSSHARTLVSNLDVGLVDEAELGLRRDSQSIQTRASDFHRTVRLVPSTTLFVYPNQASSSGSQVDISEPSPARSVASSSVSPVPSARGVSVEGDNIEGRCQELAGRCWNDDETFLPKDKIAEWLGGA